MHKHQRLPIVSGVKPKLTCIFACLIFAAACSAPQGNMTTDVPPDRGGDVPVAAVDGTYIYHSDLARYANRIGDSRIDNLEPGTRLYEESLEALIDQRLLSLDGERRALDREYETQQKLEIARERILSARRAELHMADKVTEEALRSEYEKQKTLGRTQSFADSRNEIETLLKAQAIDGLVRDLRNKADIRIMRGEAKNTENEYDNQ